MVVEVAQMPMRSSAIRGVSEIGNSDVYVPGFRIDFETMVPPEISTPSTISRCPPIMALPPKRQ